MEIEEIFKNEEEVIGNVLYNYIWTEKNSKSLFATYRIIRGLNYISLSELLSKPHGLKEIMNELLVLFSKKHSYRWQTILNKVLNDTVKDNALDTILLLNESGVLVLREKNERPSKGNYWKKIEVYIDDRALSEVNRIYGGDSDYNYWKEQLINEVNDIIFCLDEPLTQLDEKIIFYIEQGLEVLNNPQSKNKFPATIKSRQKFRTILLTFAYIRKLVSTNETMTLRTLSCLIWDDSKILEKYIKDIHVTLGEELIDLGITTNPEVFYMYGGGKYYYYEEIVSLMSGKPVILSGETILEAEFHSSNTLKNILIVENLAIFSTLLERTYFKRKDTFLLWSKGYWNSYHKKIVNGLIATSSNKLNVYIWCDLDVDGLLIAEQINNYLLNFKCKPIIELMGIIEYRMIDSKRKLTKRELKLLENIRFNNEFSDVINDMKRSRTTIEQERFLNNYKYVISKLP